MPTNSRHSPSNMANVKVTGSKSQTPRTMPRTRHEPGSFATATMRDDYCNSNFSLSSYPGSRRSYGSYDWNDTADSFPGDDDYLFHTDPLSGFDSLSVSSSNYMMPVLSGAGALDTDATYDMLASNALSRHAPMVSGVAYPSHQAPTLTQDLLPGVYNPMEANFCNQFMDDGSGLRTTAWHDRMLTPPPEPFVQAALPTQILLSSQDLYDDHSQLLEDDNICEHLGPSKLLPYSGPSRHNPVHPRPIRSASERSDTQYSGSDTSESKSSKDDNVDKVKARSNPLYDARPDKDGWYHCPMVDDYKCSHKPTRQKCVYAKYLDSHLRPYRCKFANGSGECEEARFSSNACLFRHEREAHGMHNHGVNPYLCMFPGCDRAKEGNGFPRRWNQRDHMKRVHDWIEDDSPRASSDRHTTNDSKRKKGPPGATSVRMRRSTSSSSYAKGPAAAAAYTRDNRRAVNVSRQDPRVSYINHAQAGVVGYNVSMDNVQFSRPNMTGSSRHSQSYPSGFTF